MKKCGVILTSLVLLCAQPGHAAGLFYAGISLGETQVSDGCDRPHPHCDDTDAGLKLFGGAQVTKYWGIEAAYVNLGRTTASAAESGTPLFTVDIEAFAISGTGTLPVSKKLDLFAKAGFFQWFVEAERLGVLATQHRERDGIDFTFGVGAALHLTKTLQLRIEWEQFTDIGDDYSSDVHLISGGMALYF